MKKVFSFLFKLLGILVLAVAVLLGWLTVTEFKPAPVEAVEVTRAGDADTLKGGDTLTVLSWNVGYGGLGKDSDFFMDGGKDARSADEATVKAYLGGISATIAESQADLVLLQEVNAASSSVSDVEGLAELPSLQVLNISHTAVKDLTPLKDLQMLRKVIVSLDMLPMTLDAEAYYEVFVVP